MQVRENNYIFHSKNKRISIYGYEISTFVSATADPVIFKVPEDFVEDKFDQLLKVKLNSCGAI